MTDRIDHAAKAERLVRLTDGYLERNALQAQVHATLALVEQQRISNVLALARIESENSSTPTDALDSVYDRDEPEWGATKLTTRPDLMQALGLA